MSRILRRSWYKEFTYQQRRLIDNVLDLKHKKECKDMDISGILELIKSKDSTNIKIAEEMIKSLWKSVNNRKRFK